MICSNCGTQSPAGFAYCGNCGTRLAVAETAATETRRQVAVLFADVVGFTALAEKLDPEELRSVVGSLLAELSAEVYAQGGRVDMYAGDSIMATFGAPVGHENDPALACQTALGMLEKVRTAIGWKTAPDLKIRIGINWGEVIYGRIGDSDRFTVLGDAVNVASRLQSSAEPNTAFVSDAVMARASHFYEFAPLGEISVKNRDKPVNTFKLVGISSAPEKERGIKGKTTVWVDRERELGFLGDWFGKMGSGSNLLLITGDGGVGKSRLWEEAYQRSPLRSHRLISMRCHSYNSAVPFSTVAEFGRAWLDLPARCTPALMESTVEERLHSLGFSPNKLEKELLLLMLTGVARGSVAEMDATVRLELLAGTLERILSAESSHCPLMLELDDFHWADEEGCSFLLQLLPGIQNCAVIVISRQPINLASFSALSGTLHMETLPRTEALTLVGLLLGGGIAGLNERICDVAEGNPYYIEEIIKHLMSTGVLVPGKGVIQRLTKPLAQIPLPPTLVAFITQKIDGCSARSRKVLAALAVLESTDVELLRRVSGADDLNGALLELNSQYLIVRATGGMVSPANDLITDTVLKGMLVPEVKQMHATAATILTERHQRGEDQLAAIIHHLLRADQSAEAIPWLLEAGNRAFNQGALVAALGLLRQAKSLLTAENEFHINIRISLRELEVLLALFRSREALEIITTIPQKNCSPKEQAELSVLTLLAHLRSDDLHRALNLIPKSLKQEKHLTPASRAILHLYIAQTLARSQKPALAMREAKLSLRWGRTHADIAVAAQANNVLGIIYTRMGRPRDALRYFLEALKLRKRIGKKDEIASTLTNIAMTYMSLERMTMLKRYAQQALDYARAGEDKLAEGAALINLGIAELSGSNWNGADDYFQEAYAVFDSIGAVSPRMIAEMNLALIHMNKGHLVRAVDLLEAQKQVLMQSGELVQLRDVNQMLIQLYYMRGDYARALASINGYLGGKHEKDEKDMLEYMREMKICLEFLSHRGTGFTTAESNRAVEWLCNRKTPPYAEFVPIILDGLYRGESISPSITEHLTRTIKMAREKREVLQLQFLQGIILLNAGEHDKAMVMLKKLLARFRKMDMNYFVVVCSLHLGRALRQSGQPKSAAAILSAAGSAVQIIDNPHLADAVALELAWAGGEQSSANDGYHGQL